jgi:acyl-CoA synthetase (AMP-forming)/AMP-acid ligase II
MIFRSPYPDVSIPQVPLYDFIFEHAEKNADVAAFIDGPSGRTLTYRQLVGAIRKCATGLAKKGFKKGDVFAIYSPNLMEYGIAWHAVAMLGGINTTVNPLYTVDELTFQLKDSGAKYLLTIPPFLDKATDAAKRANLREVFVFGEGPGATPFAALLDNDGDAPKADIDPGKDLVALPYSSGTTGLPKGVMLTHHNLVSNIAQCEPVGAVPEKETLVGILPFFHIYGMVVILNAGLRAGARIVTMPRFDLEQFLGLVQQHRVTRAHLVPPIVLALAKHPVVTNYDLSSLKVILSGAAPLDAELAKACAARLKCVVNQGYGMTEASPVTHLNPEQKIKMGSVGPLVPNTEAKILGLENGAELGRNQHGEICIRGPQVMQGYHHWPEDQRSIIDPAGFLHSGDVGYVDDDGYFYVVDRVKELIKYKGLQIAPAELEALLLTHPSVADAAVIPSPDTEAGEVPKAFVVLKGQVTQDALLAYVAERVAPYKKIRMLEVVEQIPKSASGKILRRVLVERERERVKAASAQS